jgi:hypothetical protein
VSTFLSTWIRRGDDQSPVEVQFHVGQIVHEIIENGLDMWINFGLW